MAIVWIVLVLLVRVQFITGNSVVNIALKKPTNMSSRFGLTSNGPEMAVDGNSDANFYSGTNMHTKAGETSAWWRVDLQTLVEQAIVKVYFRTDHKWRRNGVMLYTSGTLFSIYPEGDLCHNVTGSRDGTDINSILNVTCPGRMRHLMVYTDTDNDGQGPVLDFGEVEVYICSNGSYGYNCDKSCSSRHCAVTPTSCYRYTGECPSGGCNPGWNGTDCTQRCTSDKYGSNCIKSCSGRYCSSDSDACDHATGICPRGCRAGWMGEDCTQECSNERYGVNCMKFCKDRQCKPPSSPCDRQSGECPDGCLDGWRGVDCKSQCHSDTFIVGSKCMSCSERHCQGESDCPKDGTCSGGCQDGWTFNNCTQACPNGTYGSGCNSSCGQGNCPGNCQAGWQKGTCTTEMPAMSADNFIPVAAGGAAGLLVIVIVIAVIVVYKRRRKPPPDQSQCHSNVRSNMDNVYINVDPPLKSTMKDERASVNGASNVRRQSQKESLVMEDPELEEEILDEDVLPLNRDYYNDSADVIREITVGELAATVHKIESQEGGFEAEYSRLPTGFTASYSDSQKPENAGKNKYKGYYPYDHNRVRLSLLPDVPGSDYINASLMHSYNQRKTYIGAQAPNKKTVGDFWRMIWEHRCGRVIMLTGLVEQLVAKCYQYWPDNGKTLETNQFLIEIKTTNTRANYTIRNLKVTSKMSGESRPVVQYHFTSWPDHGVPDILALVHFIWMIRQTDTQTDGPLLVHCSAGIGRTGTYIAVDSLLDQARGEGMVDVLGYVSVMRGQRKNMIQTTEQYECVFHCLVEMTKVGNTSMDVETFTASYSNRGMHSMVDRKTLRKLTQLTVSEKQNDNPDRNRIWVAGNQDCIARAGPTLTQRRGYLMTVVPTPGLEKLLWKLVDENNVHNVIVISQLQRDFVGQKGSTLQYNGMTIKTTGQTQLTPDLMQTTLQMKGSGNPQLVKVLKLEWSPTLAELSSFLVRHAHLHHVSSDMTPSVIVYSESDEKLAVLFCIMGNILSGILQDGYVDVIGHVRSFLKCCQNLTITEEELAHLYDYASECIQMLDKAKTYDNL